MPDESDSQVAEWMERIQASRQVLPLGARTKLALAGAKEADVLSTCEYTGIVSYDASEFLITARAGTTLLELKEAVESHGQYLPFDPLYVRSGATLGGTIASGLSGPQSLLQGKLRDFVMEVEFIDGLGQLVRGGGKVVKNAAGFDFPKLMVGSYGRLGVITEVTLKVFPQPGEDRTLRATFDSFDGAVEACQVLLGQPLPISGLAISRHTDKIGYLLQSVMTAHRNSFGSLLPRVRELLQPLCTSLEEAPVELFRFDAASIPDQQSLVHVVGAPLKLMEAVRAWEDKESILNVNGTLGSFDVICHDRDRQQLGARLLEADLSGVVVDRGKNSATEGLEYLGDSSWLGMARRIQNAMDPQCKFFSFDGELRN